MKERIIQIAVSKSTKMFLTNKGRVLEWVYVLGTDINPKDHWELQDVTPPLS